jgi:hypothetical protein
MNALSHAGSKTPPSAIELIALKALRAGAALPFSYKGLHGQARCNLVVVQQADGVAVLLSEHDDNPGTSITNWYEKLATIVQQQFLSEVAPRDIAWLEHYPRNPKIFSGEKLERVRLLWDDDCQRYTHAAWQSLALF